jgi:hypothetical protein
MSSVSVSTAAPDWSTIMPQIAQRLLGQHQDQGKKGRELLWGNNGSLSVNVVTGQWYSFEAKKGGNGPHSLIIFCGAASTVAEATAWMRREGFVTVDARTTAGATTIRTPLYYDYVDEDGVLVFQVIKYPWKHGNERFSQRRPHGKGGWINNLDGVERVLYRLPEVIEAVAQGRTIWVVEGEKDADNLWRLGIAATCNPGGAGDGQWRPAYSNVLAGADVVLCGDNDVAGRQHVEAIERSLTGNARMIRTLDIAKVWPDCPKKADVSDWIETHRPNSGDALTRLADESATVSRLYLHEAMARVIHAPRVRALSAGARDVVTWLALHFDGTNNGRLFLAPEAYGRRRGVIQRYMDEARAAGVIVLVTKGHKGRCNEYAIDPEILFTQANAMQNASEII